MLVAVFDMKMMYLMKLSLSRSLILHSDETSYTLLKFQKDDMLSCWAKECHELPKCRVAKRCFENSGWKLIEYLSNIWVIICQGIWPNSISWNKWNKYKHLCVRFVCLSNYSFSIYHLTSHHTEMCVNWLKNKANYIATTFLNFKRRHHIPPSAKNQSKENTMTNVKHSKTTTM